MAVIGEVAVERLAPEVGLAIGCDDERRTFAGAGTNRSSGHGSATTGSSASNYVAPAADPSTAIDPYQYLKLRNGLSGTKPVYVPDPEYPEKPWKKGSTRDSVAGHRSKQFGRALTLLRSSVASIQDSISRQSMP
jgi:hypothetical protein